MCWPAARTCASPCPRDFTARLTGATVQALQRGPNTCLAQLDTGETLVYAIWAWTGRFDIDQDGAQTRWTTITKIDVIQSPGYQWSPGFDLPKAGYSNITQDREASTPVLSSQYYHSYLEVMQRPHPSITGSASNFVAHPAPEDAFDHRSRWRSRHRQRRGPAREEHYRHRDQNPQTISLLKHEYADYAVWPRFPTSKSSAWMEGTMSPALKSASTRSTSPASTPFPP